MSTPDHDRLTALWEAASRINLLLSDETARIQPDDPLAFDLACLRADAKQLRPWDADAQEGWVAACGALLAKVADDWQRWSWAYLLALDFNLAGYPLNFVVGLLLNRAETIMKEAL